MKTSEIIALAKACRGVFVIRLLGANRSGRNHPRLRYGENTQYKHSSLSTGRLWRQTTATTVAPTTTKQDTHVLPTSPSAPEATSYQLWPRDWPKSRSKPLACSPLSSLPMRGFPWMPSSPAVGAAQWMQASPSLSFCAPLRAPPPLLFSVLQSRAFGQESLELVPSPLSSSRRPRAFAGIKTPLARAFPHPCGLPAPMNERPRLNIRPPGSWRARFAMFASWGDCPFLGIEKRAFWGE